MLSGQRQREFLAVLLALIGSVGLLRKAGILIPFVSRAVLSFFQAPLLIVSRWLTLPSNFPVYFGMLEDQLLWCLSATWVGIAAWLGSTRDSSVEGFWRIFFYYYVFFAVAISAAVFTLCFIWDPLFKIEFHAASLSLGLLLGFFSGRIGAWAENLPRKNF